MHAARCSLLTVMPVIQSSYHDVCSRIQPGDVVAFSGKTHFSHVIKWATSSSVTHVGIVGEVAAEVTECGERVVVDLIESTFQHRDPVTGAKVGGVIRNRLCQHLDHYDGNIWWLPLAERVRSRLNMEVFAAFLRNQLGKAYDATQALKSALDVADEVGWLARFSANEEDLTRLFCSELAVAALEAGGVVGGINASEVTPVELCQFRLFSDDYHLIKGAAGEIEGFNSICLEHLWTTG